MRKTPWLIAEKHRIQHPLAHAPYGSDFGAFQIPGPCGRELKVIVSAGIPGADEMESWDHVSVSLNNRCPNWKEMHFIKQIFWGDHEAVMQLHPPESDYVDCHPNCLHMWKPTHTKIPLPPSILVGPDSSKKVKP